MSISIISQENGILTIKTSADKNWLSEKGRVYPVTIDPYIFTKQTKSDVKDVMVNESNTDQNIGTLYIGKEATYGICRILLKFTLPELSAGDMVIDSKLILRQHSSGYSGSPSSMQLNAYKITQSWSEGNIQWSAQPTIDPTVLDYHIVTSADNGTDVMWDITRVVKGWYSGESNYGIELKSAIENSSVRCAYVASNNSAHPEAFPILAVRFINSKGLEGYWDYHSQSAGRAGTGYINNYTGNLVFVTPMAATSGLRMPASASFIYDGHRAGVMSSKSINGAGWINNVSERIDITSIPNYLKYIDSDGTEHYCRPKTLPSTMYYDEDGSGMYINSVEGSYQYQIHYKDGTIKYFIGDSNGGFLHKVVDTDGNETIVNTGSYGVTSIQDGAGSTITYLYSGGRISQVQDPANRIVSLIYSGNNLTGLFYPDGKYVSYTYDAYNRLTRATDIDGSYIQYVYGSTNSYLRYKVTRVERYSSEGVRGDYITISYGTDNTSTFTYYQNGQTIKEVHHFDNVGRTTDITGDDDATTRYAYTEKSEATPQANNKLIENVAVSKPINNLLLNHSAENSTSNWNASSRPGSTYTTGTDTSNKYLGSKAFKITQSWTEADGGTSPAVCGLRQKIIPNASDIGKSFTVSGFVKTSNVIDVNTSGAGAGFYVSFYDANGVVISRSDTTVGVKGTNDWQRIRHTFTIPQNTAEYYVGFGLVNCNGTAWFDCLQLESGEVANTYNLVENGNFANSTVGAGNIPVGWTSKNLTSSDGIDSYKAVYIHGSATVDKGLYQNIYINKSASNVAFAISSKARAQSVPLSDNRNFAVKIKIVYTDSTSEEKSISFNPDTASTTGWQSTGGVVKPSAANISAGKTVNYITVSCDYYKNCNTAWFDNVQVLIDETGTSYTYSAEGNLISSTDNKNKSQTYSYTSENQLSSVITPDNKQYTYTYYTNNKYRLKNATSKSSNVQIGFTYGTYGQVTDVSVCAVDSTGTPITGGKTISSHTDYTTNGNFITGQTDPLGNTVTYNYNTTKGVLNSVTDPKGNVTSYTYNANNDALTNVTAGGLSVAYTYNNDLLTKITQNGFDYNLAYNAFGNTTSVSVGSQTLITNSYYSDYGNLLSSTYGNGHVTSFVYDKYNRLTERKYNDITAFQWVYDALGNVGKLKDFVNQKQYVYNYDLSNRLTSMEVDDGSKITYSYNTVDLTTGTEYLYNGVKTKTNIIYGPDNRVENGTSTRNGGSATSFNMTYDNLGRKTQDALSRGSMNLKRNYTYMQGAGGANTTSNQVETYEVVNGTTFITKYRYVYDANGNITHIYETDSQGIETLKKSYEYDSLNRLTRENDADANKTIVYHFNGTNLTGKAEYAYTTGTLGSMQGAVSYTYDSAWKDKLVWMNGQTITYDEIGNPLSYIGGLSFTWQNGRQLATATKSGVTSSYTYNVDGIRTSKTVGEDTTEYFLEGSTIISEKRSDGIKLEYFFDGEGTRIGFYATGIFSLDDPAAYVFYYVYNLQGDVIAITNNTGAIIAKYTYDAYGKPLGVTDANGNDISGNPTYVSNLNPFRYRGYFYDVDTGLYYLNSRYYDANTGRFISADGMVSTGQGIMGNNMFAYCNFNPVNRVDPTGMFWKEIGDFFKGVGEFIVDVFVSASETIEASLIDIGKKAVGIFKMKKVGEETQKNMAIHTENVVNAGADPNFKPKSFVGNNKQVEGYKERCVNQYQQMRIYADYVMNIDMEGKRWNDLSKDIQDELTSKMLIWDRQAYYAFARKALNDLVEIGWDVVY